jgi:hypothetical protein
VSLSYDEWEIVFRVSLTLCSFIFGTLVGGVVVTRKFEKLLKHIYFNILTKEQQSDIMEFDFKKIIDD